MIHNISIPPALIKQNFRKYEEKQLLIVVGNINSLPVVHKKSG